MGYHNAAGDHPNAAVERFMRDYYRFAMSNSTLSEMLTQHYYETLIEVRLPEDQLPIHKAINERFNRIGERIAVTHTKVKRKAAFPGRGKRPFILCAFLDMFCHLAGMTVAPQDSRGGVSPAVKPVHGIAPFRSPCSGGNHTRPIYNAFG